MTNLEELWREFLEDGVPELVKVYTLRTQLECASRLFEIGGLNKREFINELRLIRGKLTLGE